MNRSTIVRECRALFPPLRPHVIRWIDCTFEGDEWYGLYCPSHLKHTSRKADTILLNLHYIRDECSAAAKLTGSKVHEVVEELVRGTLIHELIHCEQWTMGHDPNHGTYFRERRKELHNRTGIIIP